MPSDLELFQSLTQYSRELICLHDLDGSYLFVNNTSEKITGYTPEELLGRNPYDFFHPEDREKVKKVSHEPILSGDAPSFVEYRFRKKDQSYIWLQTLSSPIRNSNGELYQIHTSSRDISEQMELKQKLLRESRLLSESNRLANIAGWEFDVLSKSFYASEQIFTILEINSESFEHPLQIFRCFAEQDQNYLREQFHRILKKGGGFDTTFPLQVPSGKTKFIRVWAQKEIIDDQIRILGSIQDITDLKEKELALHFSENKYAGIFLNSPVGLAIIGLDGIFSDTNFSMSETFGFSKEELLEKHYLSLALPEDANSIKEMFENLLFGKGDSAFGEKRFCHKSGIEIWIALVISVICDDSNQPLYYITQFKNITERKRNEEYLRLSNEKLITATEFLTNQNKQLEEFNQIVSHNLRAPLGNMLTILEMIETSETKSEKQEFFGHLKTSIRNANETLSDLIEVVKIRKNPTLEKQTLSFQDVFDKVKEMLFAQISTTNAEIETDFSSAPSIYFPKIYLESIFLNLLSNSLKYTQEDRSPFIQVQTFAIGKDVMLSFSDNGSGIDLTKHGQHVFKMHKVFHRNKGGKGIGLFLVKNQIESLGGTVQLRSSPGEGATFTLMFRGEAPN